MSQPRPGSATWDILGGVRFYLALIVACAHLCVACGVGPVFLQIAEMSAIGAVLCFLVISGYSIAQSLERSSAGFYRRRLVRVYPLYAMGVLYACVPDVLHHTLRVGAHTTLGNLAFLQTFTVPPKQYNEVVWTLAVEVACYLLAPLFVRMTTLTLLGIAGISATAFAVFPLFHNDVYYAFLPHGGALLLLGWAWMAGFIYHRHRQNLWAGAALFATLMGVASINNLYAGPYQSVTIAGVILLLVFSGRMMLPVLVRRVLAFLGDLSYPFYLFHNPTFLLLHTFAKHHGNYSVMGIALGIAGVALVIDNRMKKPVQQMADRVISRGTAIAGEIAASAQATAGLVRQLVLPGRMAGAVTSSQRAWTTLQAGQLDQAIS